MRHDLTLDGYAFRIRPIHDGDTPFVLDLRLDPKLNRWINHTSPRVEHQLVWLSNYYERPGDYYFVVEQLGTGVREGLIAIYDIDPDITFGEWGRWILRAGSMAAAESALLIYRCAFELLGLKWVCCRTIQENRWTVAFHDHCGIKNRRILERHATLDGREYDSVEHRVTADVWPYIRLRLEAHAQAAAELLKRRAA